MRLTGLSILALAATITTRVPALQLPAAEEVDRYIEIEMARERIPGLSVGVIRNGKLVKARGYGLANVELQSPATERTIYQSGSVGKQFTAAAVLLLVEDGRIALDDPISSYLPEAPAAWQGITVRHLLTHTSGIAEYTGDAVDLRRDYTEDEMLRLAAGLPVDFAPGTHWSYSNTGYVLLGIIIHRVSGRFYGDILADRIFRPLEMRTARIISEADIVPNRAAGYRMVEGALKNQEWVAPSLNTTADGSLYLTVLDLAAWDAALAGRSFLSAGSRAGMWSGVRLADGGSVPYGFGWDVDPIRGHRSVGHSGSWQGFKSHIQRYPDDSLTVIVLANLEQALPTAIAYGIAGLYLPAVRPPHLMPTDPSNPKLAARLQEFLARFGTADGQDARLIAPGLAATATPQMRAEAADAVQGLTEFAFAGCDNVTALKVERHGAAVARYCYARVATATEANAFTFWLTRDGRVAGYSSYRY